MTNVFFDVDRIAVELTNANINNSVISRFIHCLPELVCMIDTDGHVLVSNRVLDESGLLSSSSSRPESSSTFFSNFDRPSQSVLSNNMAITQAQNSIISNIQLNHVSSGLNILWSIKSAKDIGLTNAFIVTGHELKQVSVFQYIGRSILGLNSDKKSALTSKSEASVEKSTLTPPLPKVISSRHPVGKILNHDDKLSLNKQVYHRSAL
jgi:hypothetical protein